MLPLAGGGDAGCRKSGGLGCTLSGCVGVSTTARWQLAEDIGSKGELLKIEAPRVHVKGWSGKEVHRRSWVFCRERQQMHSFLGDVGESRTQGPTEGPCPSCRQMLTDGNTWGREAEKAPLQIFCFCCEPLGEVVS